MRFFPALLAVSTLFSCQPKLNFEYFRLPCAIFDRSGKLMFAKENQYMCDFSPSGEVVAYSTADNKLKLYDKNDRILWSDDTRVHHTLQFSSDKKSILLLSQEEFEYGGTRVSGDCVSVRSLENKILKQWCLKDHLEELKKLGFDFPRFPTGEISHANSVYEIPPNERAGKDPAFAAGNYIVNLFYTSYAVIILDRDLKNVVYHKNFKRFKHGPFFRILNTHDVQINERGNLFFYANNVYFENFLMTCNYTYFLMGSRAEELFTPISRPWYSAIFEVDPFTDHIYWHYKSKKLNDFRSTILGSATRFDNGHLLYSDMTRGGRAFEVDKSGEVIWTFVSPSKGASPYPAEFQFVKPLFDLSFLHKRGLL